MKRVVIHDPVFHTEFLVQKGGSLNDFIQVYLKKVGSKEQYFVEETKLARGRFISCCGHSGGAIWIHEKAGLGTITHECGHAVFNLFRITGIKFSEDTEELFTYYQQFLVNEICRKIMGWK